MDAVTRRKAVASLFEAAARAAHLQFIFLTPQDVAAVGEALKDVERATGERLPPGFVRVLTMPEPARPAGRGCSRP